MEQINSAAFRRSISFKRGSKRNGLFSRPVVTFTMQERSRETGTIVLQGRTASFTSPEDSFDLRRNFWGTSWYYNDDSGGREFGRCSIGWNFKTTFTLASGETFNLKAKRRWPFFTRIKNGLTQSATFYRDAAPVMLLQSFVPGGLFINEVSARLEGTLATDLADERIIAGLLVFYQTYLEARNRNAH